MNNGPETSVKSIAWKLGIFVAFFASINYAVDLSKGKGENELLPILISIPFLMVLVEISEKLSDIRFYLSRHDNHSSSQGTANQKQYTGNISLYRPSATSTTWECPGCGAANPASANFCQTCGHSKM